MPSDEASAPCLVARDLSKRFGARIVFHRLNFQVPFGKAVAVLGANGAGKSTLLRVVAGLERASRGEVLWHGGSSAVAQADLRPLCGLAAPDAPWPRELTTFENLQFAAEVRGLSFSAEQLREHLARFDLGTRTRDLTGELSSGLRARLSLAIATLHQPLVLLLDEPSANLDERGRELTQRVLEEQRGRGVALVATNDPREASWCDERIEVGVVPMPTADGSQ